MQEHVFCFECIESWGTTRENTCPLCKARFKTITKVDPQDQKGGSSSSKGKGRRKRPQKIKVKDRNQASSLEHAHPPHHFLLPPLILFHPQNFMELPFAAAAEDSDDDEDAAFATLEVRLPPC